MSQPGLAQISPELVEQLSGQDEGDRLRLVQRVCRLAVARSGVADPRLREALDTLAGAAGPLLQVRRRVDSLTEELEEIAWDLQELVETGAATEAEYRQAFTRARAVAAVGFALDPSLGASFDALYEAYFAIDDPQEFHRAAAALE